ncbi:hypothetical protein DYB28_016093 [Aphanomyces astaci]|uniref:Aminomethyltransferase C-terminal domain-containing protein n=1 Tax=Aphanomyces astaci TaxID=112090 RepID=A0A9X8DNX7_APHAT|nr:hypothetical protein DYB28_016093 [Aphanomyces astaci]
MNCMFRSSTFESCTTQYGTLDKRMGFKTSVRLLSIRCGNKTPNSYVYTCINLAVYSLEKGFRVWGSDMNKDTTPLEAGLHRFLKLDKATPFVGQRALQQVHYSFLQPLDAWGNEAVWCNGSVVGFTTSGGYGHTVRKSIALAYVPPELAVEGHQVDVELVGHMYKATVHLEPFMETQLMRKLKQAET